MAFALDFWNTFTDGLRPWENGVLAWMDGALENGFVSVLFTSRSHYENSLVDPGIRTRISHK
jgi:hypothetical protein